jgi:hypothetical protein
MVPVGPIGAVFPAVQGRPIKITFEAGGAGARFHVQIWKLTWVEGGLRAAMPQPDVLKPSRDGSCVYVMPPVNTTVCDGLGLIVTRVDPDETTDRIGDYAVSLDLLE